MHQKCFLRTRLIEIRKYSFLQEHGVFHVNALLAVVCYLSLSQHNRCTDHHPSHGGESESRSYCSNAVVHFVNGDVDCGLLRCQARGEVHAMDGMLVIRNTTLHRILTYGFSNVTPVCDICIDCTADPGYLEHHGNRENAGYAGPHVFGYEGKMDGPCGTGKLLEHYAERREKHQCIYNCWGVVVHSVLYLYTFRTIHYNLYCILTQYNPRDNAAV